jgi:hypothetical protein
MYVYNQTALRVTAIIDCAPPSAVFFYQLEVPGFKSAKKLVILQ